MPNPSQTLRARSTPTSGDAAHPGDYGDAYPASRRIHVEGRHGVRVPMREIVLSGGEPPLRVYDTSGPREVNVRRGLPQLRDGWIRARGDVREVGRHALPAFALERCHGDAEIPDPLNHIVLRGTGPVTQMHYARRGEVTPEMEFVALREGMDPELVHSEIARGRAILPANINHRELEPMLIGRKFRVKINANIGNKRGHLLDRGGGREAPLGDAMLQIFLRATGNATVAPIPLRNVRRGRCFPVINPLRAGLYWSLLDSVATTDGFLIRKASLVTMPKTKEDMR